MITTLDLRRITQLLFNMTLMGKLEALEEKLYFSGVIPPEETPCDLITMNSEIIFDDLSKNERHTLRLVYQLSPLYGNQTSVLSPLGTALLGMRVNEETIYKLRDGSYRKIKILGMLFQPEANRQFEL